MRMFAWVNLLADDGYATRMLAFFQIDTLFRGIGLLDQGAGWLDGQSISVVMALVYGYVPFMISSPSTRPSTASTSAYRGRARSRRQPGEAFRRVTLPLSMPGILGGLV